MVTKDLQTLNLKLDKVMFNSLVLRWERNFELTFGIFSDQKCEIVIIEAFKSKFCQYVVFTKKILHGFVSFCISLIFMYCLFAEKNC